MLMKISIYDIYFTFCVVVCVICLVLCKKCVTRRLYPRAQENTITAATLECQSKMMTMSGIIFFKEVVECSAIMHFSGEMILSPFLHP